MGSLGTDRPHGESRSGHEAASGRRRAIGLGAIGTGAIALAILAIGGIGKATAPPRAAALLAAPDPHLPASPPGSLPAAASPSTPPLQRFRAAVGDDLSAALRRAGVPDPLAREYVGQMMRVDRFAAELSVADRFDLVVAHFQGEPPLLVYAGMDRVRRGDLQFFKYGDGHGRIEWVDARGPEREQRGGFALPVGGRITSGFGMRMHPLLGIVRFHRGIDLAAAWGTPIRAAADGRVVAAGWHGGYGRQVALAHGGGLDTSYSHMSRILARAGEMVRRGQVIGLVGSSGLSTGPHVHFEATRNGRAIDPRAARIDAPVAMSAGQRAAFDGQLRAVLMASGA